MVYCTCIDIYLSKGDVLDDIADGESHSELREFSFIKITSKIFGESVNRPGSIPVLNGLRFFNMAWVVLGHQLLMHVLSPTVNSKYFLEVVRSFFLANYKLNNQKATKNFMFKFFSGLNHGSRYIYLLLLTQSIHFSQ